ncbi:PAS domain S-box protein [Reyranella sp.]|uniref:PAS domain S-box protein n=1 Tax=Reyranella sp. TaxID=1929291 RepID=UPI003783DFC3
MAIEAPALAPPGSSWGRLVAFLRNIPGQMRLALGIAGVRWAALAGVIGLLSCAAAFVDIGLSLRHSDVGFQKASVVRVFPIEDASRELARSVLLSFSAPDAPGRAARISDAWRAFDSVLGEGCAALAAGRIDNGELGRLCSLHPSLRQTYAAIDAALAAGQPLPPSAVGEIVRMRMIVDEIQERALHSVDTQFERLIQDYESRLLTLLVSTLGFVSAGIVLILLVGHMALKFHAQWREATAARAKSEDTLQLLQETIESLPAGIVVYGADDKLMLFNSTAASISPVLDQPDAIGKTYEELARDSGRMMAERGEAVSADNGPEAWIARFNRKGSLLRRAVGERWFEWSERRTAGGRTVGLRADVTALKTHELEAERLRIEFETLVASLSDMVFKFELLSGKLTFASASARDLFGWPPEHLLVGRAIDLVVPEDHEALIELTREMLRAGENTVHQVRFRIRTADGSIKHVESRFRRMPGAVPTVVGALRDVEMQTQLAERLEAERARLRSIVESSGALVVVTDRELGIVLANSGFAELIGVPVDQAVGRKLPEVLRLPRDNPAMKQWLDSTFVGRNLPATQFATRHKDPAGVRRTLGITVKPAVDKDGRVSQFVFVGVDDTVRRDAEQALFVAERLAVIGEMSAAIAHEVAQPLQVINLACHSALDELEGIDGKAPDLAFVRTRLDRIGEQVERGTKIVGDLRNFVHGLTDAAAEPFDPAESVRFAAGLTEHALRESDVKLSLALDGPLPKVLGQARKLEQVFVNLINNARDSGGTEVEVQAVVERQADGRDFVRLSVLDNGPGISPAVLNRLFEAFVTTKERGKGTGLGLRVCRRIVDEMGGTISGANRPEGGARFDVFLPTMVAAAAA